jgi:hypothetical protein
MNTVSINSYSERRVIREELQREDVEGVSLDPALKCVCPNCNSVHYKAKQEEVKPARVEVENAGNKYRLD